MRRMIIVLTLTLFLANGVLLGDLSYTTPSINNDILPMQGSGGVFSWTNTTSAVGGWSAKLDWPGTGGYAQARVFPAPAGVSTVGSINNWSYWAQAPASYMTNLSFVLDDPDISNNGPIYSGVGYDTVATIWPSNAGQGNTWLNTSSGQSISYTVWTNAYSGGPVMKTMTWGQFKAPWSQWGNNFDFSNASVLRMNLGKGVIGTNQTITAYVDDFQLNNYTYTFEPVPVPGAALLGMIGLGLVGWVRRRFA